jgi:hypothetical protein
LSAKTVEIFQRQDPRYKACDTCGASIGTA